MKTKKTKLIQTILTIATILLFTQNVKSQDELTRFLNPNIEDANKLVEAWTQPFLAASGVNLTNSWYVCAEPLNLGRFEIRLIGMSSFASMEDKSFKVSELGLTNLELQSGTPDQTPTIFGGNKDNVASLIVSANNPLTNNMDSIGSFKSPNGTGLTFLPAFTPQINLGLFKGTEIMVRYIPEITYGDFTRTGFGVGIKHDILQWIPLAKEAPVSFSFVGTYGKSNLKINTTILKPQEGIPNPNPADYTTQSIEFKNAAWSAGLAVSKKLPVLTFFGGLQLSSSTSSIGLYGPYPVVAPNNSGNIETTNLIDPINLEVKHTQFGMNAGMRRVLVKLQSSKEIIKVYKRAMGAAHRALQGLIVDYKAGARTILDLLDAEDELFDTEEKLQKREMENVRNIIDYLWYTSKLSLSNLKQYL